jgi:hypothetical protein
MSTVNSAKNVKAASQGPKTVAKAVTVGTVVIGSVQVSTDGTLDALPVKKVQMSKEEMKHQPCFTHFGDQKGCKFGKKCWRSHEDSDYAAYYNVHRCEECKVGWCKAARCADCRSKWHKCATNGCEEQCRNSETCYACKGYHKCQWCTFWFKDADLCPSCNTDKSYVYVPPPPPKMFPCKGNKCSKLVPKGRRFCPDCQWCEGVNCPKKATPGFTFCKECHAVNKQYISRRPKASAQGEVVEVPAHGPVDNDPIDPASLEDVTDE